MNPKEKLSYLLAISSVVAGMGMVQHSQAQVQTAGDLLVSVDATALPEGTLRSIANSGTMGGLFEARAGGNQVPFVGQVGGTKAIRFDGNDYMQLVGDLGETPIAPPAGLVGLDPTRSIEVWAYNPTIEGEETMVSWGRRGGGNGSNISFNYGSSGAFGAIGHWGAPDIGWNLPGGAPAARQWHHLVYTYDGTTTRVYSDGVLSNTEVLGAGVINTHANTAINLGAQLEPDGVTVTGGLRGKLNLGRVRIHDEVLSDAQILNNYTVEQADFINPSTATAALASAPNHRYSFSESPAADADAAALVDSMGGENGVVRGAGTSLSGSRLVLTGGPSATQGFGDLPNGLLSRNGALNGGSGQFSIEGWVRITGNRTWSRIFDFGSTDIGGGVGGEVSAAGGGGTGLDYLMYSAQIGGNVNGHQLATRNEDPPGGGDGATDILPLAVFDTDLHFVVTWNESSGQIKAYENGNELGALFTDDKLSDINDVNVWLGRSNWAGDQNTQGQYDEIRIYDHVLNQAEVLGNFQAGPDTLPIGGPLAFTQQPADASVAEFATAVFRVAVRGQPPIALQWYKNDVAIPGATGTALTLANIPLSDNNARIYCGATDGGGNALTSATAILQVSSDSTPPTLTGLRLHTLSAVEVSFSEAINASDAADTSKFTLTTPDGVTTLASAQLSANPAKVLLTASAPLACGDIVVSVTGVRDASILGNPVTPNSTAKFFHFIPGGVTHLYNFNTVNSGDASAGVLTDLIGGDNGAVRGAGATFSGDKLVLPGGSSATAAYGDLPNRLLSNNSANRGGSGQLTFEGWLKITGARTWSRVLDFGSSVGQEVTGPGGGGEGSDYLAVSAQIGDDTGNHRFEIRNEDPAGGGIVTVDYPSATFNNDLHIALTWDEASGTIRSYENGTLRGTIFTDDKMSDINDVNVWLGRSNWTVDQNTQGEWDEFRVYDKALTDQEVSNSYNAGLENDYGAVGFLNISLPSLTMLQGTTQQLQVSVDFEKAFGVELTGSPCVRYLSDNPAVAGVDARGLITGLSPGSAGISARFAGVEEFVFITVTSQPATFTAQPAGQIIDEFGTATFTVGVAGSQPIAIQWFKNGVAIPGATAATLTLTGVPYSDNNAIIHATASNFATATSENAILTVIPDTTAPLLAEARLDTLSSVEVIFSEPVRADDAALVANYTLSGHDGPVALIGAQPTANPSHVIVTAAAALPCGSLTMAVRNVRDVSAAANPIAAGSTASFFHLIPGGLAHQYTFNNLAGPAPSGSQVRDLIGSAHGDIKGVNARFNGDRAVLGGGGSGSAAYIDLPNGLLSANGVSRGGSGGVTLEGWVKITGNRTWSRIWDIGSSEVSPGVGGEVTGPGGGGAGMDYLMLSAQIDVDTANHRVELRNEDPAGGGIVTGDYASTGFGNDTHYAMTWNEATGEITTYENGAQVGRIVTDDKLSDINDVNVWLGRSNWTGDQNTQGEYDEFRVYNRVLSAGDIANNHNVGVDNNYGTPGFINLSVASASMDVGGSQQLQVTVDFERALDVNLTSSPCVHYESSNTGVLTVDAQGVIRAVGGGSATIAAFVAGLQETQAITVRIPNRPPVCGGGAVSVLEDSQVNFQLTASDPDGDALMYVVTTPPLHGGLTVHNTTGAATYVPSPGYAGGDSFEFTVRDPSGLSSAGCTVSIAVIPLEPPVCQGSAVSVVENGTVGFQLLASDPDGDSLTYVITRPPAHGQFSVTINTGACFYSPNSGYTGGDSLDFMVRNSHGKSSGICTVTITVLSANQPPTVVIEVGPASDLGPTVPGITLIAANNENVCATLDGSGTSDPDGDAIVSYLWLVDGVPAGAGAVVDACLLVGPREITLQATDARGAVGSATVPVDVLTGGEAIEELVMVVNDSVVDRKNKRPFIATLKTAAAALDRGSVGSAVNRLSNAFQNKVQAQIGKNNPDDADEWIRIAQEIIDAIEAPQDCAACE